MREVELIPLGSSSRGLGLDVVRDGIMRVLPVTVHIRDARFTIEDAFDTSRQQYHSTQILARMLEHASAGESKMLGITSFDLFIPVLTFVFGQAQLDNRAAVFSLFRLHNEFYGLPSSQELLFERATKEALHELGHTFGLRHCQEHPCVMNSSTYVEDIDLKPGYFCLPCSRHMHSVA